MNLRFIYKLFLVALFFSPLSISAQNYMWWNTIHHWDGHTWWYHYLTFSSAFMGANALPVPEIKDGKINSNYVFTQNFAQHSMKGDLTLNLENKLNIPLSTNVALLFYIVPIEYYQTDTIVRDKRAARERSGKGFAAGDLNIATQIRLCEESKIRPAILLTINLRTASGGKMISARYTDAPGYYFDLSSSKQIRLNNFFRLKIEAQMGFYVWQTNLANNPQDDALEYGLGLDILYRKFTLKNQLGAYSGYLKNGDRPMIQNIIIQTNRAGKFNFMLKFQQGWRDYAYRSFFWGMKYTFKKRK